VGRHSQPKGDPPTTPAGRWEVHPGPDDASDAPDATPANAASADATPANATPANATPADATPANAASPRGQKPAEAGDSGSKRAGHAPLRDNTGRIPTVSPATEASVPASAGDVLTRRADPTQVIARVRPDTPPPRVPDPSGTTTIARTDGHTNEAQTSDTQTDDTYADVATTDVASTDVASTDVASTDVASTDDAATDVASADDAATDVASTDDAATADAADPDAAPADRTHSRRHGRVWAGLAVFWLLALGAGLVTLASLGAPHYLCTGTASTGLACGRTGTVIAAILTVVLIVAVGWVSALAIEQRAQGRTPWRWLGIGVIVLVVVASCGYLLIRTIGG
jgi:hypothetical protein